LMNEYSFTILNNHSLDVSMSPRASDPIQEQLIQARRSQILDAATQVFAEKGFQRATIRDVATAAGIADGTIYNYFENKTALLLGILDRLNETEEREAQFGQMEEMDARTFARNYIKQRYEVLTQFGFQAFQVLISEILVNKELRERYYEQVVEPTFAIAEKYYQTLADEGLIRPLDIPLTLRAISGMFLGVLIERMMGDSVLQEKWDDVPDLMAELILTGIENNQRGES